MHQDVVVPVGHSAYGRVGSSAAAAAVAAAAAAAAAVAAFHDEVVSLHQDWVSR